jgi:hypothetical protein
MNGIPFREAFVENDPLFPPFDPARGSTNMKPALAPEVMKPIMAGELM